MEFLRTDRVWEDGRREGSAGGVACPGLRAGSGGGAGRPGAGDDDAEGGSPFSWLTVRRGSGGGIFSAAARAGRGGIEGLPSPATGPDADLLAVSVAARTGRGGGGGGARFPAVGGGAWKFFCWLRAAMRSASVAKRGSSASPIAGCCRQKPAVLSSCARRGG